ncbi:hypothetical protein ADK41_27795 [Streptomyces caelestis]|uniref:Uncharacterized protein n=1 Tax=Streptomyces caelestis TaxID=36816 RepID=A0A0M9X6Y6_9ACTN|nr:hypothetical protein ADK41_27795 [Streptomyces caelestis]KOV23345.1 hypothetical protein ADK58_24670 [Streptomyces sp. XY152]
MAFLTASAWRSGAAPPIAPYVNGAPDARGTPLMPSPAVCGSTVRASSPKRARTVFADSSRPTRRPRSRCPVVARTW